MPTYEYACRECGEHLEVVQSFKDDPLTECPNCKGELRKVFGSVGIVFKGSGFYKTDSRPAGKSSSSESTTAKSECAKREPAKTETKSDSSSDKKSSDSKASDTKASAAAS